MWKSGWKINKDWVKGKEKWMLLLVCIIVGTLVRVGRGFYTPEQVQEILEAKNRKAAGVTAPPQGLFLVGIEYEE